MSIFRSLKNRFGFADTTADRGPIHVMLLDDDERRHRWFKKRFSGDFLDVAVTVEEAKDLLVETPYDAIFLDHDLLPRHYESNDHDDFSNTGYAIAEFLCDRPELS